MNSAVTKFLFGLSLLGLIGALASDTTVVQKIILFVAPLIAWLLFENLVHRFRA